MTACQLTLLQILGTFVSLISLCPFDVAAQDDWCQWGGNQRDFKIPDLSFVEKTDFSQVKETWRTKLGSGNSSVCVQGKMAFACFTSNEKEQVVALSIVDGSEIWRRTFTVRSYDFLDLEFGLGPHATPLVSNKLLFCVGLTGRLSALSTDTGETVWERQLWTDGIHTKLQRGFAASPVAFNDTIILPVGGNRRSVRCFAMKDGTLRWQKHDFDSAYASPIVARLGGRQQVVLFMDQSLVGLDPDTGNLLWRHPVPTDNYVNCSTPVIGPGDSIFINTCEGLRGLNLKTQSNRFHIDQSWSSRIAINQTSNFIHHQGVLYGAKEGSVFAAVDATNGHTLWQSRLLKNSTIAAAGDHLIAVQENGLLVIAKVTRHGIESKWRKQKLTGRCWAGPIASKGLLLVRDSEILIAIKLPK